MPTLASNITPDWANPKQASVFDSPLTQALRLLAKVIGADNPESQVLGLAAPLETATPTGGLAPLIKRGVSGTTQSLRSLAEALKQGPAAGVYDMTQPIFRRMGGMLNIGQSMPTRPVWDSTEKLLDAFGGDREKARMFARLVGSTSPNTPVPKNTREALSALIHHLENPGVPLTEASAQQLDPQKITLAGSKVPNINLAYRGLSPQSPKVDAFSELMMGEPRIPIDVHALHAAGSAADKFDTEIPALRAMMTTAEGLPHRGGLKGDWPIYQRVEEAMAAALRELSPKEPVNQSFATMWDGTRMSKGLKAQPSVNDILRMKGLDKVGAMLDPERLRAVLKTAGWTGAAVTAVMNALGQGSTPDTTTEEQQ